MQLLHLTHEETENQEIWQISIASQYVDMDQTSRPVTNLWAILLGHYTVLSNRERESESVEWRKQKQAWQAINSEAESSFGD